MDLSKMYQAQKELDKPYENEPHRLDKDILWLYEEVGEVLREWRGHKYRREVQTPASFHVGDKNPLLEEYTDGLAVILSIGLQLGVPAYEMFHVYELNGMTVVQFHRCFNKINILRVDGGTINIIELTREYLTLGMMLGFSEQEIEQSYMAKVPRNRERQHA